MSTTRVPQNVFAIAPSTKLLEQVLLDQILQDPDELRRTAEVALSRSVREGLVFAIENPEWFRKQYACWITEVRNAGERHSYKRPGWTPLHRSLVARRPGALLHVQWNFALRSEMDTDG